MSHAISTVPHHILLRGKHTQLCSDWLQTGSPAQYVGNIHSSVLTSDWISTPVCGKHTQLCSDWLQTGSPPQCVGNIHSSVLTDFRLDLHPNVWETYTALFWLTSDWISTPMCGKHTQLCSDRLQTGSPPQYVGNIHNSVLTDFRLDRGNLQYIWLEGSGLSITQSASANQNVTIFHTKNLQCHYACLTS